VIGLVGSVAMLVFYDTLTGLIVGACRRASAAGAAQFGARAPTALHCVRVRKPAK